MAPNSTMAATGATQMKPPTGDVIVVEDLWRTYEMGDQQVQALRGISLRIKYNEYVAIMGTSGSG